MVSTIMVGLIVISGMLITIIAMQPDEFRVERTAVLKAPASEVFAQVNDLRKWDAWSPWAKLDPNAKSTFEGAPFGKGAVMAWAGNNKIGEGKMTIIESRQDELIRTKLEFLKPFKATNTGEFTFRQEGDHTNVTWSMEGTNNFMSKAVSLVMDCEKMVGGQFEQGLANLKAVVEK